MADAWGGSWGSSWGFSWGGSIAPVITDRGGDGGAEPRKKRRYQQKRIRYLIYKDDEVQPVTAKPKTLEPVRSAVVASAMDLMRIMGVEPPPEMVPRAVFTPVGMATDPSGLARAWAALVALQQAAIRAEQDDDEYEIEMLLMSA